MERTQKSRVIDMTKGDPARLLLVFALPLFFGNLLQQFYNLADTSIAGHILGDNALAQIGAFQFDGRMQEDRAAAWSDYCQLCRRGGSLGYFQTLSSAGLDNPFQPGTVEKAVRGVFQDLGL